MPVYGLPGVTVDRRRSRILGVVVVVIVVVVTLVWSRTGPNPEAGRLRVVVRTAQLGDGMTGGTTVQLDGVDIGSIDTVARTGQGDQLITLALNRSEADELTDTFEVEYAPSNLFGVATLVLRHTTGGAPLRDGELIDLTGPRATRVDDATMGALLRSLAQTANQVLTPDLTALLTKFNEDLRSFTPILNTIVMLSRAVADTQRYASSYLFGQYGGLLSGAGDFTSATFRLFDAIFGIQILETDRPRYDAAIALLTDQIFPEFARAADAAHDHLSGYADMLAPLADAIAHTVPTPATSRTQLRELLARLDRMFTDAPDGPALDLAIVLRGLPALTVPLGQQLSVSEGGR
ncbi:MULTISPECIES: mammalian cell entry protein [unclassified Nocardia]|uniref:mammalian cell entry protein n=1 Tax=unclassified Nocardia TaxID=2637762 RepID=UPI001CE3CC7A|nr:MULTISPECIES: mammalian cell entry protein [unclassified Nocardia]